MAVEVWWHETGTVVSVRLEEEEGWSGHVGRTGQQAGWLAGPKGRVGLAERLRPSGEGRTAGWLGQRPSGLVRVAGPKARNE
jgi:hypothetical protein